MRVCGRAREQQRQGQDQNMRFVSHWVFSSAPERVPG
jgi:hypothetical protein